MNEEEFYFQQDGPPPHYHHDVGAYLYENLLNRWIGRRGSIELPPRSPDLTSLDFIFDLRGAIEIVCTQIPNAMIRDT